MAAPGDVSRRASLAEEEDVDPLAAGQSQDLDFGSLISFANLENVMTHIVKKFKANEKEMFMAGEAVKELKKEIEGHATTNALTTVSTELRDKIGECMNQHNLHREFTSALEMQMDRLKLQNTVLEKRLDAMHSEKAVQDRILRETQEAMQDKVPLSELRCFEAKFSGYCTKNEHQELIATLGSYTTMEVTDRLVEAVKMIGTKFEEYSRTAKIEQRFQEFRDWVRDELLHYAKLATTNTELEELGRQMRDQSNVSGRLHASLEDTLRAMSDRITSVYTEFSSELQARAYGTDLQKLSDEMAKYASKADTEAFQRECGPKLKFCVDAIKAFDSRIHLQDDAIRRVDEVLLDKAGKYDCVVLNARIDSCFEKSKAMAEFRDMYERLDWMKRHLDDYILREDERLSKYKPVDYKALFDEMKTTLELKADKADLVEIHQVKANRLDADDIAKLQELIHRQLEYLSVTTFGLAKLSLTEGKPSENKSIRAQQKNQVLMQSEALWHWVLNNEAPPNLDSLRRPSTASATGGSRPPQPPSSARGASRAVNSAPAGDQFSQSERRLPALAA
eukprot:TRINITY_DN3564_c0_g3_i1.p1 TRINITY_DN3564_c0_g3~~TRINITY_DN3564_c0_g3_i1.p1  ORF type:complete len:646 (+),score=111.09 TRINITY_DN3564_c0_g3_i1:249-1940(+)